MSYIFKNDSTLISDLINGNESAYVYLIKTYHKPLLYYAISLINDKEIAKDIVQDVFLLIWKNRNKLNKVYALKSYLYKITYHEFIDIYRKDNAVTNVEKAFMEALNDTVDESNIELLERKIAIVTENIAKLPPRCKEIFLLSKKEGLTNIEITNYLDISIKTVEGHMAKAYALLRKNSGDDLKTILFLLFSGNLKAKI